MKNLRYLTGFVIFLAIGGCINGQFRKTVNGNGNVVKKERAVNDSFTGIKVSSGIDAYITQGDVPGIVVEADENLHEYILTEIKGGILNIYTDVEIRHADIRRVHVVMKDIKSLSTTSAGDIIGETPVRTDDLALNASSAGDIKLEVYAKTIEADGSSSGDITLSGEADFLKADMSSAGDLKAYDLKVREANVIVSSAGDADIYVTDKLTARSSSAGDINYKGDPKYIDAHSSSAGDINKK
ncbi:MAG: head GIN domain-containing protein [Bacteroidales bacterium]|jgi:hypothetical protein